MSAFALRFNKLFSVQKCFHSYQLQYILPISTTSSSLQEHSPYVFKRNETFEIKKARLLYQSRKRGMLENDLLLSTFAEKFLNTFTTNQLELYDKLINLPSNDWDIYYWATGVKETPLEFQNEIMELFKKHVSNKNCETRFRQPDINS